MINQLYIFSVGSFVVSDEWNANFKELKTSNDDCTAAIIDANNSVAFPDSDLSQLRAVYHSRANSFAITGSTVAAQVGCEYYKTLSSGEDLTVNIPNRDGEYRILIKTNERRELDPITINYSGQVIKKYILSDYINAGYKMIFIFVSNGKCLVKMGAMS